MATQPSPGGRPKCWILCSSGAQPLYLENIVRALALPEAEELQYRYEEDIVADVFRTLVPTGDLHASQLAKGDTAYLSYLDNRDKTKAPKVYPVREAVVTSASRLGSTYIVRMQLRRFLDWSTDPDLCKTIASLALAPLPGWGPAPASGGDPDYTGFWLCPTQPLDAQIFVRYNARSRTHLSAFESTVRAISPGADFADGTRMFANILGVYDVRDRCLVTYSELKAGRAYDLYVYHYQADDDTHKELADFRMELTTDTEDIIIVGQSDRHIEARYDEVVFTLQVKEEARTAATNIGFNLKRHDAGKTEPVYILRSRLRYSVTSAFWRRFLSGLIIGVGLFGTQTVALLASDKLTGGDLLLALTGAFIFSTLAGMGLAFQFKTKP